MPLPRIRLAPNGPEFSRLVYGTWRILDDAGANAQELNRRLNLCVDLGMTTLDTAEIYGLYEVEEALGKAIALSEDQGFIKVIFDKKTGQLLGAHMVGAEVTELIQGYVVAMNLETTEEELMHTIFPHPTISETMKEAVLDAYGRVLNM